MEKIDNEYLEREFNNNYKVHEIFKYQGHATLDTLIKKIKDSNEILLEINNNNITPFYKHRENFEFESIEEYSFWNHIISVLFMQELSDSYDIETNHDILLEKKILTGESFEDYQKYEKILINRNDVIEAIKKLNVDKKRVHIVLRFVNNEFIWKELVNYLEDDLPFITMIYSDSDIYRFTVNGKGNECGFPTDVYKYIMFEKDKKGYESYRLEDSKNGCLKYEKKI